MILVYPSPPIIFDEFNKEMDHNWIGGFNIDVCWDRFYMDCGAAP